MSWRTEPRRIKQKTGGGEEKNKELRGWTQTKTRGTVVGTKKGEKEKLKRKG